MQKVFLLLGVSLIAVGVVMALVSDSGTGFYQTGVASWYGPNFQGNPTASGEVFDMNEMTAAHKSLPFGTRVRVVDMSTGNKVVVKINDRGPFIKDRIIDLSFQAAKKLGIVDTGTAEVGLKILEWGNSD